MVRDMHKMQHIAYSAMIEVSRTYIYTLNKKSNAFKIPWQLGGADDARNTEYP